MSKYSTLSKVSRLLRPLLVLAFAFTLSIRAEAQIAVSTASIPVKAPGVPATDLVDENGQVVSVQELQALRLRGKDLSTLNPESTDLWDLKKNPLSQSLGLRPHEKVTFESLADSRTGNLRFNGFVDSPTGKQSFQFFLSRTVHNMLLRDALLRKLGFNLDPIQYVPKMRVEFRTTIEAQNFMQTLRSKTSGAVSRWIVGGSPEEKFFELQDVVGFNSLLVNYSLAQGGLPAQTIQGRRILNSLIVPYSLVQIPESVNLLSWEAGSIFSNAIQLESESGANFTATFDDGRWAARRILELSRKDLEEIVAFAQYPREVSMLVTEKLVSRRNSLRKLFSLEAAKFAFNEKVSSGTLLKNGKLTNAYEDNWPGYGARFAFGDPESPLASSQIPYLLRSEGQGLLIENAVNQFNSKILKGTNIGEALYKKAIDRQIKDLEHFIETGEMQSANKGFDAVPFFNARLLLSRDIVTGSYLGTDNIVSLVDSIGVAISVGQHFEMYGLTGTQQARISAAGSVTRTYSHFTPVKSLKAALKSPFKNVAVPLLTKKHASLLKVFETKDAKELNTEAGKKEVLAALADFKENLSIGESFVITDSIGPNLTIGFGQGVGDINVFLEVFARHTVIGRTYILRSGEDSIQIYRDTGNLNSFGIALDASLEVQILSAELSFQSGRAKTQFYTLNLKPIEAATEITDVDVQKYQSLAQLLRSGSLELLKEAEKPYVLTRKMRAQNSGIGLLIWKWNWQSISDFVTIEAPTGHSRNYQRRLQAARSAKNYEDFTLDVATALARQALGNEITLSRRGSNDPGSSILGSSQTRLVDLEAEVIDLDGKKGKIENEVVKVGYRWRGWSADRKKLVAIVDNMNKKVGSELFSDAILNNTTAVKLYSFQFNMVIYERAIDQLISRGRAKLRQMAQAARGEQMGERADDYFDALDRARKSGKFDDYSKRLVKLVGYLEKNLEFQEFVALLGGMDNVFIYARLEGFREGDETGDQPLISSSLGEVGGKFSQGPLTDVRRKLGITESELFGSWFVEAL